MEEKKKLIKYPGKKEGDNADKLSQLIDYLKDMKPEKFTGYIKINFSQGNLGRIEKFEEILKQKYPS